MWTKYFFKTDLMHKFESDNIMFTDEDLKKLFNEELKKKLLPKPSMHLTHPLTIINTYEVF